MASPTPRRGGRLLDALVAVVLLGLAAALRARPLAPHSLWIDDAWVSLLWKVHSVEDVRRISVASPGFVVLLKAWFSVVHFSSLRAQLPAFVCGILGPPAVYLAARAWRLGRPAAVLAAGVILTSPMHIRYSSRVKAFAVEALAATIVLVIADRLLSQPQQRARWYAFGGAAVLATVLSAPLGIVVVPGFVAGILAARRAGTVPRAAVQTTTLYACFGFAWYLLAIRTAIDSNLVAYWKRYYISHAGVGDVFRSLWHDYSRLARGFTPLPAALTVLALAACAAFAIRTRPDRAVLLFGPLVLATALAALERNPLGGGRTDIYLYADLALALAFGADALLSRINLGIAGVAAVGLVVLLSIITLPLPTYPKEDLRSMLAIVDAHASRHDEILLYPKARFATALYSDWPFHLRGPVPGTSVTTPFDVMIDRDDVVVPADTDPVRFTNSVATVAARSARIWYVGSHADVRGWRRGEDALRRAGYVQKLRRGFPPHYWVGLWVRATPGSS
ncbi:MAG TPA: hypothetical protein VH914_10565 [Acidimicrobiia bacterium]|nr:hypothetical protein [Acidimicrobiia bacterium]